MRVLIVEDEAKVAQLLLKGFDEAGYNAEYSNNGNEAFALAMAEDYDLLIVDVMLPGRDGFSLVEELRKNQKDMPVLFLSAKRSAEDRIEGLQRGGDDYLVKPFSFSELLLRSQSLLRRSSKQVESKKLRFQDLEMDLLSRTVKRGDTVIALHQKEFALLECLLRNQDRILSKTQILEKVWKYDFDPQTNVVDVLVCRLRIKIDRDFQKKFIKTIRGVGYAIRE
ncbi:MAG: response regulator transcription factor [Bdellovibrionaceae bacterium]|nr:response regulator transcription factor [Pseudobdellovibrionaceae bacterium]